MRFCLKFVRMIALWAVLWTDRLLWLVAFPFEVRLVVQIGTVRVRKARDQTKKKIKLDGETLVSSRSTSQGDDVGLHTVGFHLIL